MSTVVYWTVPLMITVVQTVRSFTLTNCLNRRKYMNLINNGDQPEATERLETYLLDSLCSPT